MHGVRGYRHKEGKVIGAVRRKAARVYVRLGYRARVRGAHENSRAGHVAQSTET